jgi:SAM-dependent methyltransferase
MQVGSTVFHRSWHLGESNLEPPKAECPFCGSRDRRPMFRLQDDPEVVLLLCRTCRAASASRMPTDDALVTYYQRYYEPSPGARRDERITVNDPLRFGKYLAAAVRTYLRGGRVSILDFGGGDGAIAQSVATRLLADGVDQVHITVVDYNETTVTPQDSRITIIRNRTLDCVDTRDVSFVIASAIIEHLPAPRAALEALLNCVARGGVFYARTPYIAPLMGLLRRVGINMDFTYPGHVHDLGQSFWETYFAGRAAGEFRVLASRPSIVETTFRKHLLRTAAAHALKAPWYLLRRSYKLVGGWEVLVQRIADSGRVGRGPPEMPDGKIEAPA